MSKKRRFPAPLLLLALLTALAGGCGGDDTAPSGSSSNSQADSAMSIVDLDSRRPKDRRHERAFTLDNGMDVLLVTDPDMQKSSAGLDVAVGSLEDSWDHLGMAHFLEHLLFLGTEKYPEVEDYSTFLSSNQGSSNAYTAGTHTNYQFEVNHEAFEGALDRFAQFFVAPLFNPEFIEREMNAVHSEHQKNLQNDYWRTRMVQRHLHADGHPRQKFSTGDLSTLEGTSREVLIDFYKNYYSANVMKLALMGTASLDEMEALVREKFSAVKNHDRADLDYDARVFDPKGMPEFIQVKPVTDSRTVVLTFPTRTTTELYATKPGRLIGSLIGHEGAGSLLSLLKRENLATGLSAGLQNTTYSGKMNIRIELTDKGREQVEHIIGLFYSYVDMLKAEGLKEYYYEESRKMSELDYYYREHGEGMQTASGYAAAMQEHPALDRQRNQMLLTQYDPEAFESILAALRPDNMRVTLVAPDVVTDTVEKHYGTDYSVGTFTPATIAKWKAAKRHEALSYPAPNPFIPDDVSLLTNDPKQEPYKLIEDAVGTVWFQQDRSFALPRANVALLLQSDKINASPRSRLLTNLYVQAINESLNEWRYPVREAGLFAGIGDSSRGIQLNLTGYSQRIPELMEALAGRLADITIDEKAFADIKTRQERAYANNDFDLPYQQVFYEFSSATHVHAIHRRDYKEMVASVSLQEVKDFAKTVLKETWIEGTAYGNLDPAVLSESIRAAFDTVASASLSPESRRANYDTTVLPKGKTLANVWSTKADNNCWMSYAQFGPHSAAREAAIRMGAAYLKTPFYAEMRTKQQLGYIVFSGAYLNTDGPGMYFLIQSGTHDARDLSQRAETFLTSSLESMKDMDDTAFAAFQQSIVSKLQEEDVDMASRAARIANVGHNLDGDFDYKERVIAAIEALKKEQMADIFKKAFDPQSGARMSFYYDAAGAPTTTAREDEILIADLTAYKKTVRGFKGPTGTLEQH